jgi:hypothetical protein
MATPSRSQDPALSNEQAEDFTDFTDFHARDYAPSVEIGTSSSGLTIKLTGARPQPRGNKKTRTRASG